MTTFEPGVSTSPGFGFSTISTTPWAGGVTQEAAALAAGVADGTAWAAGSANASVLRSAVSSPTIIALIPQAEVRGERKLPSTRVIPSWTITLRPPVVGSLCQAYPGRADAAHERQTSDCHQGERSRPSTNDWNSSRGTRRRRLAWLAAVRIGVG